MEFRPISAAILGLQAENTPQTGALREVAAGRRGTAPRRPARARASSPNVWAAARANPRVIRRADGHMRGRCVRACARPPRQLQLLAAGVHLGLPWGAAGAMDVNTHPISVCVDLVTIYLDHNPHALLPGRPRTPALSCTPT